MFICGFIKRRDMRPQHQRAVERLVERFEKDPNFLALMIGGSIVRGWERDDSDVDFILLATDEEYARRAPANALTYYTPDLCDYPGGYVDGKIVDWGFLAEVAARGSETARAAFVGARRAYSSSVASRIKSTSESSRSQPRAIEPPIISARKFGSFSNRSTNRSTAL